jgi:hypothetical protein
MSLGSTNDGSRRQRRLTDFRELDYRRGCDARNFRGTGYGTEIEFRVLLDAFRCHRCRQNQRVTTGNLTVTAEVAGSSPVVPAIETKGFGLLWQAQ